MKLSKAIKVLSHHQRWRLGKEDKMKYSPNQLTEAIDIALNIISIISKIT